MNAPTDIPNAVVEYSATEAGLADLRTRLAGVVFNCTTKDGDKAAREARRELVTLRTSLDKLRLKLNADDAARIKARNDRATEIDGEIRALEDPIDGEIKAEEGRIEAARQARIRAEADRRRGINARLEWIRGRVVELAGRPVAEVLEAIKDLEAAPLTADLYAEFSDEAQAAREAALSKLRAMLVQASHNEAEAARLAEQKRKLDEQQAALDREDAERKARNAREDAERAELRKADDAARAFLIAWDDAVREDGQRAEDAERARSTRIAENLLAAQRAEEEREEAEAAAERKRQRDALEIRADSWLAIHLAIKTLESTGDPAGRIGHALVTLRAAYRARDELAALDTAGKPAEADEAGVRG